MISKQEIEGMIILEWTSIHEIKEKFYKHKISKESAIVMEGIHLSRISDLKNVLYFTKEGIIEWLNYEKNILAAYLKQEKDFFQLFKNLDIESRDILFPCRDEISRNIKKRFQTISLLESILKINLENRTKLTFPSQCEEA